MFSLASSGNPRFPPHRMAATLTPRNAKPTPCLAAEVGLLNTEVTPVGVPGAPGLLRFTALLAAYATGIRAVVASHGGEA